MTCIYSATVAGFYSAVDSIVGTIAEGMFQESMQEKMDSLRTRKRELEADLTNATPIIRSLLESIHLLPNGSGGLEIELVGFLAAGGGIPKRTKPP